MITQYEIKTVKLPENKNFDENKHGSFATIPFFKGTSIPVESNWRKFLHKKTEPSLKINKKNKIEEEIK